MAGSPTLLPIPIVRAYEIIVQGEGRPRVWVNITQQRVFCRGGDGRVRSFDYAGNCPECGDPLGEHGV